MANINIINPTMVQNVRVGASDAPVSPESSGSRAGSQKFTFENSPRVPFVSSIALPASPQESPASSPDHSLDRARAAFAMLMNPDKARQALVSLPSPAESPMAPRVVVDELTRQALVSLPTPPDSPIAPRVVLDEATRRALVSLPSPPESPKSKEDFCIPVPSVPEDDLVRFDDLPINESPQQSPLHRAKGVFASALNLNDAAESAGSISHPPRAPFAGYQHLRVSIPDENDQITGFTGSLSPTASPAVEVQEQFPDLRNLARIPLRASTDHRAAPGPFSGSDNQAIFFNDPLGTVTQDSPKDFVHPDDLAPESPNSDISEDRTWYVEHGSYEAVDEDESSKEARERYNEVYRQRMQAGSTGIKPDLSVEESDDDMADDEITLNRLASKNCSKAPKLYDEYDSETGYRDLTFSPRAAQPVAVQAASVPAQPVALAAPAAAVPATSNQVVFTGQFGKFEVFDVLSP